MVPVVVGSIPITHPIFLMNTTGKIIIVSGPSGVGKGTVIREVLKSLKNLHLSVSATTRAPRDGEVDGREYHFLSHEVFDKHIRDDAFLEWCEVHGQKYGTLKAEVLDRLHEARHVILEIDIHGAEKIREFTDQLVSIFIVPPSFQTLFQRLKDRNTEDEDSVNSRLHIAAQELAAIGKYHYIVVNDNLADASRDVIGIIDSLEE